MINVDRGPSVKLVTDRPVQPRNLGRRIVFTPEGTMLYDPTTDTLYRPSGSKVS